MLATHILLIALRSLKVELNYWLIIGFIFIFLIGIFFGIYLVKFFSNEIIYKLENSFESQLEKSEIFYENAQKIIMTKVHKKIDTIEQINAVLVKFKELLHRNSIELEKLNSTCNVRKELESEIVKLKKIIQRMERNR